MEKPFKSPKKKSQKTPKKKKTREARTNLPHTPWLWRRGAHPLLFSNTRKKRKETIPRATKHPENRRKPVPGE